jgi:hypothetical protein
MSYKISVCYFPKKGEVEATWENEEGERVDVTFSIDEETGMKLAELVPCGVYHDAVLTGKGESDDRNTGTTRQKQTTNEGTKRVGLFN